ncbi:MAG: hypothetical protein KBT88_02065 [Gammaproteobacteria bacterium]|nr:hypothetical protein [Gammaproteobacteria bacterium]MBQ0838544.1 hypothetical protein [Gammaproteobacteria bacterium]
MNIKHQAGLTASVLALSASALISPSAAAFDASVSGFIRQEMAYKIGGDQNPNNPNGNPLNGKTVPNTVLDHPGGCALLDALTLLTVAQGGEAYGSCLLGTMPPNITKPFIDNENDWNVFATRAQIDIDMNISNNMTGRMQIRGYYQPDVFDDYGDPNLFTVNNHGDEATYLSISGSNYMVDMPMAYIDYAKGPLWIRFGNQQIAWGEALFFRVADVANGLDLRRHLFLDFGAEEYADERLSSPGVRASYTFGTDWELEVFAQMFQPTIIPNRGSPYSFLPYPFTVDFETGFDQVDDAINGGVRLQGQIGNLGVQFFAVSRHNPDPIFKLVPGNGTAEGLLNGPLPVLGGGSGELMGSQPFYLDESGEFGFDSWRHWFGSTSLAGIDGLGLLNTLIEEYGFLDDAFTLFSYFGLTDGFGDPNVSTIEQGRYIVDTLATAFGGPLRAGGQAVYTAENIYGLGFNYIFYAEPDTFMDQLVLRFEGSYTPDKKFTDPSLSSDFIVSDEWITSVTIEKYQRFTDAFPATFFIFEWMHKSESDMLGRHLSGLGGDRNHLPGGGEDGRGWDALVFALQQPFPDLKWRIDMSILYDLNGGFFMQPAVRYKPSNTWSVEAFANIIDASNSGSIFASTEFSDDFTVRINYQF